MVELWLGPDLELVPSGFPTTAAGFGANTIDRRDDAGERRSVDLNGSMVRRRGRKAVVAMAAWREKVG